jgi:hypothetical protein
MNEPRIQIICDDASHRQPQMIGLFGRTTDGRWWSLETAAEMIGGPESRQVRNGVEPVPNGRVPWTQVEVDWCPRFAAGCDLDSHVLEFETNSGMYEGWVSRFGRPVGERPTVGLRCNCGRHPKLGAGALSEFLEATRMAGLSWITVAAIERWATR